MNLFRRLFHRPAVDWLSDRDAEFVDIFSFHRAERFAVHEARSEADRGSSARQTWHAPTVRKLRARRRREAA